MELQIVPVRDVWESLSKFLLFPIPHFLGG